MSIAKRALAHIREFVLPSVTEEQSLAKCRLAAWTRLCLVLPLLYGFTLYSLLSAWREQPESIIYRSATLVWVAFAALYVVLTVVTLICRNVRLAAILSLACIALELANNEVIVFLTGAAASHALSFIIIAVSVYRVFFDYWHGLFAALFGVLLHAATILLLLSGLLPPSPVQYSPDNAISLAWMAQNSLAALACGVLIAFSTINLGMNRLHMAQRQVVERWSKDMDSIEQFRSQVLNCSDESGVYKETMKAILYATPVRMAAILEKLDGECRVNITHGIGSDLLEGIRGCLNVHAPDDGQVLHVDGFGSGVSPVCFSLGSEEGRSVFLVACCEGLDEHRRILLGSIAGGAGAALSALQRLADERAKAYTDSLTGLNNKRFFLERWPQWLRQAGESGSCLCVAMIDIDHFKQYNDAYGHLAGDDLLKSAASTISGAMREGDVAARFGGEEFVIVLFKANLEKGLQVAERIRAAVQAMAGGLREVTVSVGLACYPDDSVEPDELLACADKRLYEAKRSGRNRVCH